MRHGRATLLAAAAAVVASLFGAAHASAAPSYPDVVVMVSGYNSSSAFTTPDPACAGKEGDTWANPDGPAAALRAAGEYVFTAPVHRGTDPQLAPCAPGGAPIPDPSTEIDSFGDNDANGAALAAFLAFLKTDYGVERVQLVAHSDGGNWSRSAITQGAAFAGLDVRSLTTLGTPYTGSMIADLGTELRNGKCDFKDPLEQDVCNALLEEIQLIYNGMGPTAVDQLTHTYLEGWNQRQAIGSCPVTTIAGTGVDLPLVPFSFYNPSDGLVGEASALAHSGFALPNFQTIPAPVIPGLRSGGTFPVVHAPALSFISKANLLNTPAISSDVTSIVTSTPPGPLCNVNADAGAEPATAAGRYELPLRAQVVAAGDGGLGPAHSGDVVVAPPGATVRCGRVHVPTIPLLADQRISLALPDDCPSGLRASGRQRALLVRAHRAHDAVVQVHGDRLRVRVRGGGVRRLRAQLVYGGARHPLKLDRRGFAQVPEGADGASVVVRAVLRGAHRRLSAAAPLAL